MLGEVIDGRYLLLRVLGQGGMGAVYEAEHTGTGRHVAVKVILSAELAADATMLQRFQREARAAGSIETQHVVQVLDVGTDPGSARPYLVMELLHGEDLRRLLKRCGALPPDVALRLVGQACAGLLKAHEAGVVHRDIKPGNLFLSRREDGEIVVKVVDFGIAKLSTGEALTATGDVLGSPQYMSPEQVKQGKLIDHRTDIWSIGVVLYEALAGRRPQAHCDNLGAMLLALCTEPAPPLQDVAPWVPPEVARLVHGALTIDMNARFESMPAMLEALRRLVPDGLSLRADSLISLTTEQRAHVAPRALDIPSVAPAAARTSASAESTAGPESRSGTDTSTTVPLHVLRSAPPHKPVRRSMLAMVVVLGAAGAAGAVYRLAGIGGSPPQRDAPIASAEASSAPSAGVAATAPVEPAPVPAPAELTVRVVIEPSSATVAIDDREVPVNDGSVELRGVLASRHQVRVRQGKNETVREVIITESGPVPPKIEIDVPIAQGQPVPPRPTAPSPGATSTVQALPAPSTSPAAPQPTASAVASPHASTASPAVKPTAKPANTGVSRTFDE